MTTRHRNETSIMIFAVIAAVVIHCVAIFAAKEMKIDFASSGKALMENQKAPRFDHDQQAAKLEEIKRKNEELAEILNHIVQQPVENKTLKYDIKDVTPETFTTEIEDVNTKLTLNDDAEQLLEADLAANQDLMDSLPPVKSTAGEERLSSKFLRRPTPVEILFPHDEYLADELIMATEMAQGNLAPETAEEIITANDIKAGKAENASISGTSLQNRSGMLDHGAVDATMGSGGTFSLSSEFGNLNYSALSQMYQQAPREALLPKANKNELRGFDYNSLGAIASSDDFNLNVEYAPRKEGGYIFKLELLPKPGIKFKRITQNVFFLIDRSHSIRYTRYEITKQAVSKALALLNPGDTFNVMIFDDNVVRLSSANLPWNSSNLQKALDFIQDQKYGGVFATTDLYSSLGTIVPEAVKESEVNTAILLSDGDTYLSSEKQRNNIGNWTQKNSGKVSLFAVASGKGNNLALLDLLSFVNKGSLQYSATDKGLEATLFKLMQSIRNPIGKDITVKSVSQDPSVKIVIYPANQFMPNLYENSPFIVYGVINQLKDFHAFIQGKYYDKFLDIKQTVSFAKAKRVEDNTLEKKLALQSAYIAYEKFLNDGQTSHLTEAKQLLSPFRIPVAFK